MHSFGGALTRPCSILPLMILFAALAPAWVPSRAACQVVDVVTEELSPFQIVRDNKIGGFATVIVNAAFERAGIAHTITAYPWARAYNQALTKANTCIYSIARTPEREGMFKWAARIARMNIRMYAYKREEAPCAPADLEEARGCAIVVMRNDAMHQYLLSKGFTAEKNLFVVSTHKELFRALATFKGVSLVVMDDITLQSRAEDAGVPVDKLVPLFPIPELSLEQWIAFSKTTPDDIVSRFSRAFQSLEADGSVARIKKAWRVPPQ